MARAASSPRLADVDERRLVVEVVDQVRARALRLVDALGPGIEVEVRDQGVQIEEIAPRTRVGVLVARLVVYAQRGDMGVFCTEAMMNALREVCGARYGGPEVSERIIPFVEEIADASDPLELVLLGAAARLELGMNQPVSAKLLGVLAGIDPCSMRRLGDIEPINRATKPWRFRARAARAWLRRRDVAGFAAS